MSSNAQNALSVDPWWAHIWFGVFQPMRVDFSDFLAVLRTIDERSGAGQPWTVPGMPVYVLTRYDDVRSAFLDTDTFSPRNGHQTFTFPILRPTLSGLSGRGDSLCRRVIQSQFSVQWMTKNAALRLRPGAHALVDRFCSDGEADLIGQFAQLYPLAVVGGLLGLPVEEWCGMSQWVKYLALSGDVDGPSEDTAQIDARRQQATKECGEWLQPLIKSRRRGCGGEDGLARLVNSFVDSQQLSDEQIMRCILLLFCDGLDATWLAIGNMMAAVLSTGGAAERLNDDAELRYWALEETLRWAPPVPLHATLTVRDVDIRGTHIPAGSMVMLSILSANRDTTRFPEPDRWDLDRRPTQHLTFRTPEHFSPGSHLTRAQMLIALEVLLARLPNLQLIEQPSYGGILIRGPKALRVSFDSTARTH
ncbi:hypothetical protein K875_05651 [Mycobacterium [tuberculosis] TKK-01-0051]|uniref:Cytochrome P450 n=1 Tax=Mycobacterium [tuberculosis] TKK-01-0051 TaxID=1324261 RepID=A0A051TK40_9MYCO|nr:cytochrome P450 [Mycobacterium colombiense]KBZ57133.1 hypothetical protein K875_05651 [Mycobacterium [tuberculosis] TKK-01-0051]